MCYSFESVNFNLNKSNFDDKRCFLMKTLKYNYTQTWNSVPYGNYFVQNKTFVRSREKLSNLK